MSADGQARAKNLLKQFLQWWSRCSKGRSEHAQLEALDSAEVEHMAREFGVSADQLLAVSQSRGRASELLHRMMRVNGLSLEELRRSHPDVARDLEIHCSLCNEKRRCRRELESGDAPEGFADYCPNASTFVELQAETLQRLV
jgi:uncharacterized protein DUF6455